MGFMLAIMVNPMRIRLDGLMRLRAWSEIGQQAAGKGSLGEKKRKDCQQNDNTAWRTATTQSGQDYYCSSQNR